MVTSLIKAIDFSYENDLYNNGYQLVAGIDEVGRGCLAGPVVVSAVILDKNNIPKDIYDSKAISAKKRLFLYDKILETSKGVSIVSLGAPLIDKVNILKATLQAMQHAINNLVPEPDYILIDGRDTPKNLAVEAKAIVKGDQKCLSIAAASIVAKVTRDKMLAQIDKFYPNYGFESHVGYGTKKHILAIGEQGAIKKIHRYSFSPIKDTYSHD